jgi:membrane protease YdiL (CAAX protease family)
MSATSVPEPSNPDSSPSSSKGQADGQSASTGNLLILIATCLLSGMAFMALGMSLAPIWPGIPLVELMELLQGQPQKPPPSWEEIQALMARAGYEVSQAARTLFMMQGLTTFGFFVLPGLWFLQHRRDGRRPEQRHPLLPSVRQGPLLTVHLLPVAILLAYLPLIYNLYHLNLGIQLLPWSDSLMLELKGAEERAERMLQVMMEPDGTGFWFLGILVLALLPALGEEMVFRGCLQSLLGRLWGRPHAAIWVSALLFSAVHGQWMGFVPRCLLGAMFGYLFWHSGSLWTAVLAHFANNLYSFLGYRFKWMENAAEGLSQGAVYVLTEWPVAWGWALGGAVLGTLCWYAWWMLAAQNHE